MQNAGIIYQNIQSAGPLAEFLQVACYSSPYDFLFLSVF